MQINQQEDAQKFLQQESFKFCCEYFSLSPQTVLADETILADVLEKNSEVTSLIMGYCEMADLNSEICRDFLSCENDLALF